MLAVGKPLGMNKSIHGLIDSLTQAGSDSKQALQRMYALCDGTKQSVADVPDVQIFARNGTECSAHTEAVDISKIARIVKHCNSFLTGGGRADQIAQTDVLLYNKTPQPRANVLYGLLSLVNHSCCPNSTYYILNEAAVLRAGQDLAPGDEVTISYFGDLSSHKDLRQRTLGVAWHFACSCPRCTVEEALHWKTQSMIDCLGTEADKYSSHDPDRCSYSSRAALVTGRRSRYLELARELNEGLSILEEKLCKTDLPLEHQHWAMFSVLEAYLCLWQFTKP